MATSATDAVYYDFVNAYDDSVVEDPEVKPLIKKRAESMASFLRMYQIGIMRTRVIHNEITYHISMRLQK